MSNETLPQRVSRFSGELVNDFLEDDCMSQAAAVAYYTTFALAPLLVIAITIAAFTLRRIGLVDDTGDVQEQIVRQIQSTIGTKPAEQVAEMVAQASKPEKSSVMTVLSVFVLVFTATATFAQIQLALNRVWGVVPDPRKGGVKMFIKKRLLSFGLVVTVGFLLLVSLLISILLEAFGGWVTRSIGIDLESWMPFVIQTVLNFVVITLVFALMLKYLPDARLKWRDVWLGAIITTLLFGIGRLLIGTYVARFDVASGFGAAGSLVLLLTWVYYSAIIFLFGAEFTQVWMRFCGRAIIPQRGAIAIVKKPQPVPCHPPEV